MRRFTALLHAKRFSATSFAAFFALGTFLPLSANAQLDNQSGIANPARVEDQIGEELTVPQVSPDIDVKQMELQGAPPGSEKIVFKFGGLHIEGATVYAANELAALYQDKIGTEISLADVYAIANQMTLKYRNDGYILTQVIVPPQTIEGGVARVEVVEGFIDHVAVQTEDGEGAAAVQIIKGYASQMSKTGAVNVRNLERQLLLINDLPGVKARSILSPSKTVKGAADLLVIVERKSYDAQISVDNFGSRYLGPNQIGVAGTVNSLLGANDALSAQVVLAPAINDFWLNIDEGPELAYGSVSYEMPVGMYGTKVGGQLSITHTDPGYDLAPFDVNGHSEFLRLQATHPFVRTRSINLYGRVLFDWRSVQSSNNVEPNRRDHIRALRTGLRYEFLDKLLGVAFNSVDLEISKGLDLLGASEEGDDNMTRPFADPQFTKAELELQRLQRLTEDFNLLLEGRAQLANDALLSSEEFGVGGINSARGYDPSEIVGDDGISGRAEIQWKNPGNLQNNNAYVEKYQLYTFWDGGRVWNTDNTTDSNKRDSVNSAGLGVRASFQSGIDGGLAIAFPLSRDVQTEGDKDPKVYFNVSKKF